MNNSRSLFLLSFFLLFVSTYLFAAQNGWKEVAESVKPSVLMIEMEVLANIENEEPGCYQATGFIVDAEKGIILTNRHVVGSSPATARATFWNKEKIPVTAVYYDSIHDFGFYKFNPKLLRWTKPKALKLGDSDKVKIGEEIRVLGNNASEGFAIIAGTISWVKKNAPLYSDLDTYREFNTYYFQTSADVTGGSSGGPIINQLGEVIAINSSSKRETTVSWGLPINVVKNALESVRKGSKIARGDIGAKVIFSSFDEIIEYGFPKKLITGLKRENKEIEGLLTVLEIAPGTDASKKLKTGDVIWQIDGELIEDSFAKYERILNSKVGKKVNIKLIRDGVSVSENVEVIDLEKLKIRSYVRIGQDYFTNIPIFLSLAYNLPMEGVFASQIKYNFSEREDFPDFLVINELGGSKIRNINDLAARLKELKSGQEVRMKYIVLREEQRQEEKVFEIDWKWFKPEFFKFKESSNEWIKEF
jgi:pro-apoptotic serine protease NMA111